MSTCQCSMAISMLGDGCRYCQPQTYIEHLLETLEDARAVPVSEAKAQGVIDFVFSGELPNATFVEVEDGNGNSINAGGWFKRDDGYSVLRLAAAPVQQVGVPDGWKLVPVEPTPEMINAGNDAAHAGGCDLYRLTREVMNAYPAMLAAAPAAPAADAGGVLEQAMYTLISIDYHENSGLVHELRQALAAHRAKGVV